jgi:hypothetical protein
MHRVPPFGPNRALLALFCGVCIATAGILLLTAGDPPRNHGRPTPSNCSSFDHECALDRARLASDCQRVVTALNGSASATLHDRCDDAAVLARDRIARWAAANRESDALLPCVYCAVRPHRRGSVQVPQRNSNSSSPGQSAREQLNSLQNAGCGKLLSRLSLTLLLPVSPPPAQRQQPWRILCAR